MFTQIKPKTVFYKDKKSGCRSYDIFLPGFWTDVINDIFLKEHKLSCNYIYKRDKVSRDIMNSQNYIWFSTKCKDRDSKMEGWTNTESKCSEDIILIIRINDTRETETLHETKRPIKGLERQNIGEELSSDIGSN